MDAATKAAFERVIAQVKAHPLYLLAPADAEAQLRAAIADGIDRREARKIQAALDTPQERAAIVEYVQTLGIAKGDVDTLLRWLLAAVVQALEDAEPVDVEPDKPAPDGDILTTAQWWAGSQHEREAGSFPVVAQLSVKGFNGWAGNFVTDKAIGGACVLCMHRLVDGVWIGGPIDGIDSDGNASKTVENYAYPRRHGPLSEDQDRARLTPRKGEVVAWSIVSIDRRARSSVAMAPFPVSVGGGSSAPAPAPIPSTMPADLPGTGQSGFLWKPSAEGGGGGLVVLFNGKLRPFVVSATINGAAKAKQVPPYEDGRGAIRWPGKSFAGRVELAFQLSDGRELRYTIPNGKVRTERVRPAVA